MRLESSPDCGLSSPKHTPVVVIPHLFTVYRYSSRICALFLILVGLSVAFFLSCRCNIEAPSSSSVRRGDVEVDERLERLLKLGPDLARVLAEREEDLHALDGEQKWQKRGVSVLCRKWDDRGTQVYSVPAKDDGS